MKRLTLYLAETEYEAIRSGSFLDKVNMSDWVRDKVFSDKVEKEIKEQISKLTGHDKSLTPLKVINKPKDIIKRTNINSSGLCKKCGSGLKPDGDFCMGKGNHKQ